MGYALSHAYGAAFDNPDLLIAAVVGDGEAETGALATSWHSNKFINPALDGVVLPILHLNGYKIANPTVLARIPQEELRALMIGYGHKPFFFEVPDDNSEDHTDAHRRFAALLDDVLNEIAEIKARATAGDDAQRSDEEERRNSTAGEESRPQWPMIVFRHPKGPGPAYIDGKRRPGRGGRTRFHWPMPATPGAPASSGRLADVLPARGTIRRGRAGQGRHHRPGAEGHAADERQPARQRRVVA